MIKLKKNAVFALIFALADGTLQVEKHQRECNTAKSR
jgi:hypothetical protein